jgi:hypothetical protein
VKRLTRNGPQTQANRANVNHQLRCHDEPSALKRAAFRSTTLASIIASWGLLVVGLNAMTENPIKSARAKLADALSRFDKSIQAAVSISESRIGIDHTGRQNKALLIFAKLIAHCLSIKLILDSYQSAPNGVGLLDHFSVATLGRAATDASLMTMYISKPDLKRDEWELRKTILYLHELLNRKRFLSASVAEADRKELPFFETTRRIKPNLRDK